MKLARENQTSQPLVSILVPTFNPTAHLFEAITSFGAQTYPNVEVIIVDDGSQTGSDFIQAVVIPRFNLKKIFLRENSGSCGKPLNQGLMNCSGSYICICAQDDFFYPEKIEVQVNFMINNPQYAMAFSDCDIKVGSQARSYIPNTPKRRGGMIFEDLILQRFYIPSVSVILKRDIFFKVGLYDESVLIEDWDMHLRVSKDHFVGYIPKSLAVYRIHPGSISNLRMMSMHDARMSVLSKWSFLSIYKNAVIVTKFLDFRITGGSLIFLIKGFFVALVVLGQPYRIIRILLGHIISIAFRKSHSERQRKSHNYG